MGTNDQNTNKCRLAINKHYSGTQLQEYALLASQQHANDLAASTKHWFYWLGMLTDGQTLSLFKIV